MRICECVEISDEGVEGLARLCLELHTLDVSGTQVTEEAVDRLRAAYPGLSVIVD